MYRDISYGDIYSGIRRNFRRLYSHDTRIRLIGVFDTAGPLGIPRYRNPLRNVLNRRMTFHDVSLSGTVDAGYQALAIDEVRRAFPAELWHSSPHGTDIEQVWFSGTHSDIGGVGQNRAMSDIPLLWMIERARSAGLAFDGSMLTDVRPDPLVDHEFPAARRPQDYRPIGSATNEAVSEAAVARYANRDDYSPPNLAAFLSAHGVRAP
jgi:hypothetical protein